MKKFATMVLILAALFLALTGCSRTEKKETVTETAAETVTTGTFDPSQAKTMGDLLVYEEKGDYQEAFSDKKFVLVFNADGIFYRAEADLTKEAADIVWGEEYDEERDQKVRKAIAALEVKSIENLSERIPKQEELDKLIGKTGQELFDDGWTYWSYNLIDMEAGMVHGTFSYDVRFKYDGEPMVNSDDFDFYKEFKDLPVISVTYAGLGDAANPEE